MGDKEKKDPRDNPFYEKRAKRLKFLDNALKVCKENQLSVSLEQFEEALKIAYELLEVAMSNDVQQQLYELLKKSTALVERIEAEDERTINS